VGSDQRTEKFKKVCGQISAQWGQEISYNSDEEQLRLDINVERDALPKVCEWIFTTLGYCFATLVVEEGDEKWSIRYIFYGERGYGQIHVIVQFPLNEKSLPSISPGIHAADWQEREVEDLFGLIFEGHPRLGDFVLHEQWPEGVNPMRRSFDATKAYKWKEQIAYWTPQAIVSAPGAFMMPIGPVYSDHAEAAQFFLETVGEDVIRTIPRFFYKYRAVEKVAEGHRIDKALLLAERFSGTSAFAHSLGLCQAVENALRVELPPRARYLRVVLAELERIRHHVAAIRGICSSTALAVATAQFSIVEEELLRLTCLLTGHRYLFGLNVAGGLSRDIPEGKLKGMFERLLEILERIGNLYHMLRFTSSFLDRLEEVGVVSKEKASSYGLVGPIARASGVAMDLRADQPYAGYTEKITFDTAKEQEGDGYARLRVLFAEIGQSVDIIRQTLDILPGGPVNHDIKVRECAGLGWVEAPKGAALHWIRLDRDGRVKRYRVMSPSFVNWHGFHLAAEDFAFQDFPIIMATFALSNAECDR